MPDETHNIRCFLAFRVFFNARFYYPVFAVLFVDYGLTMAQFALLNVVWAAAIILFEVPSGALADQIGRKRMVVAAACLMVVEMLLLAAAPTGAAAGGWLFAVMLLNRMLSGAAEAAASGADEALAYDSIEPGKQPTAWPVVLERLGRWQAFGFIAAMLIGAAVFDPAFETHVRTFLSLSWLPQGELALRLPGALTLLMAFGALAAALSMREPARDSGKRFDAGMTWSAALRTGLWIWRTRYVLLLILTGVCFDNVVRLVLTFQSTYLRLIEYPDYSFGIIGAAMGALGFVIPALARRMVSAFRIQTNFALLAGLIFASLLGLALALPWWGLAFAILLGAAMYFAGFFLSHYLNLAVTPERRATVLSFKGLAVNIAYGLAGILFGGLLHLLRNRSPDAGESLLFAEALQWLPGYFLGTLLALILFAAVSKKRSTNTFFQ